MKLRRSYTENGVLEIFLKKLDLFVPRGVKLLLFLQKV